MAGWRKLTLLTLQQIIPGYFKLVQAQTKEAQDDARKDLVDSLREVSEKIKGPYYAGHDFGAVDISLAPFLMRYGTSG